MNRETNMLARSISRRSFFNTESSKSCPIVEFPVVQRLPHDRTLDAERLQSLVDLDLAVVVDDVAVSIVPRIKRWPVPHDDLFAPPTA